MNIGLSLGCLLALAVLGGVTVADSDYCLCRYDPNLKGCTLGEAKQGTSVCQCELLEEEGYCIGQVVQCLDIDSPNCLNSGKTYENCKQGVYNGKGNCCGYNSADQNCISDPVPVRSNTPPAGAQQEQAGVSSQTADIKCRYWCRKPNNNPFCCEYDFQDIVPPHTKEGKCPLVRTGCPVVNRVNLTPDQCSSDGSCPGKEKCCWDLCLDHYTCKSTKN